MISLETWVILTPLQKLPNNVGDLGKIIVATGFEWLTQSAKNRPTWSHWFGRIWITQTNYDEVKESVDSA